MDTPTVTITVDTSAFTEADRTKFLKELDKHGLAWVHQPRPSISPDRRMHKFYYEVKVPEAHAHKFAGKVKKVSK